MGESCCGGGDKGRAAQPVPGVQQNGTHPQANGAQKPSKTHKEAASELEGFISKRIQLFNQYHERELQRVYTCATATP